jgi:hypothetical protein
MLNVDSGLRLAREESEVLELEGFLHLQEMPQFPSVMAQAPRPRLIRLHPSSPNPRVTR